MLTDYISYADTQAHFSIEALWELFDGDKAQFNIAHETLDRHRDLPATAMHLLQPDGSMIELSWAALADASSQFAHELERRGVPRGAHVAIMLEPSLAFYAAMFGTIKRGAISLPLFTLFGPDAVRTRLADCGAVLLVTNEEKAAVAHEAFENVLIADDAFMTGLAAHPKAYAWQTKPEDMAITQYTSGTTRDLPQAVRQTHKALVTHMISALYGLGLRPGDRYFCPSSPAWAHGLWHGTLAPLTLGVATGTVAGKFDAAHLLAALERLRITTFAAAATHYRFMKNAGTARNHVFCVKKLSFAGEPLDDATADFIEETFGTHATSIYGTSEVGAILVGYPGAPDLPMRRGSLGRPVPGIRVEVLDPERKPCPPGEVGEIMVHRRGQWIPTRDLGRIDEDGFMFHVSRADDVIISAGWTISPNEVEDAVLRHPDVKEAGVIGVPDRLRGNVVKAFVVSERAGDDRFAVEIQDVVRERLAAHEYPRQIVFVAELPKTPAGKVNRRALRVTLAQTMSTTQQSPAA